MFEVLRRVPPKEIDETLVASGEELKRDAAWKKSWVLSILALPESPFHRPGEQLRFEVLMAELIQSGVDPALTVLNCLDKCDRPNRNHYLLAALIHSGHVVMTTNFDRLIELAYADLFPSEVPLRIACFDGDFAADDGKPALWKLHGSLSVGERATRDSVQATMMSILSTTMTSHKATFVKRVLADFDLLVVGYSGWDDLDVIPLLSNTRSDKTLIWVDHGNSTIPEIKNANQLNEAAMAHWEIDSIGRDRIRFSMAGDGKEIRDPMKILTISVQTSEMMEAIRRVHLSSQTFPTTTNDFHFGSRFSGEVQKYFDDWITNLSFPRSSPYEFVVDIFSNRAIARAHVDAQVGPVRARLSELRDAPDAMPAEQLQGLIEKFNQTYEGDNDRLQWLAESVQSLMPMLPEDLVGTAARLYACLVWSLYGREAGTQQFQAAVAIDRAAGRDQPELSTLTTWRQFNGYNQWSDLFAEYEDEEIRSRIDQAHLDTLRRRLTRESYFPEDETRRIHELTAKLGFFPLLWSQAIRGFEVIDDDPQVLLILHNRIRKMKRFCVDMGDVLGEAQATLISGRMNSIDRQFQVAIEEFLRVRELQRIVNAPELTFDVTRHLMYSTNQIGIEYMHKIKPHLQRSMWGRVVEPDETGLDLT